LLAEMKKRGERDAGGKGPRVGSHAATQLPKLADLGVSKTQSSRWQTLAGLDPKTFESQVASARKRASNGLDAVRPGATRSRPTTRPPISAARSTPAMP
jgi:hypothetical protein